MKFSISILLNFALFSVSFAFLQGIIPYLKTLVDQLSEELEFPFEQYYFIEAYDELPLDELKHIGNQLATISNSSDYPEHQLKAISNSSDSSEHPLETIFASSEHRLEIISNSSDSSNDSRTNLGNLSDHLQGMIADYLPNGFEILRQMNLNTFKNSKIYPVKYYVDRRFDIPELKDIDENEPELYGILSLSWCRNDPFLLFSALLEDLVSGKKPYKVLVPHLVKYLARTFKEFTEDQRQKYEAYSSEKYSCSIEYRLGKVCLQNNLYDLIFEVLTDNPSVLNKFISYEVQNWNEFMIFLKSKPELALKYQRSFFYYDRDQISSHIIDIINFTKWIGECLIREAPEIFFTDNLDLEPERISDIFKYFFIYQNIPESEYSRIYAKIINLIDRYPHVYGEGAFYSYYRFIIKIGFDPDYLNEENELILSNLDEKDLIEVGHAAMFGNKSEIFRKCHIKMRDLMDTISIRNYNKKNYEGRKNFKVFFEVIASEGQESRFFRDEQHFLFIMMFYAIKHLKFERGDRIVLEFVALQDLLDLGFPPTIYATLSQFSINNHLFFLNKVFEHIKVADEDTFSSFLIDYEKYLRLKIFSWIHFECLQIIMQSPRSIELFKKRNMHFEILPSSHDLHKLYDLFNVKGISEIIGSVPIKWEDLTKVRSKEYLKIAKDWNWGKTVDEL